MLAGINDRVEQAAQLARLLDRKIYKVNLIPYNPTGAYAGLDRATRSPPSRPCSTVPGYRRRSA